MLIFKNITRFPISDILNHQKIYTEINSKKN